MSPTQTTKQWTVVSTEKGFDGLQLQEGPVPPVGDHDVLVRLRGASLNYRDLIIPRGEYPFPIHLPVVAGSDGAGEVVEVGPRVTRWKKGDRVVTLFNQGHQYGEATVRASGTGLGGMLDGTLRRLGVFHEDGLVPAPANLNFREASTLTCAGLTSWNALYGLRPIKAGDTVLVQGTGGVSIFALQFAKAAGATVIATTSSAAKADRLRKLGADHVINYQTDPRWGETARQLTPGGEGVDYVIEVGGAATLPQTLKAVKMGGIVSIIGFLGGTKPDVTALDALNHLCTFRGVYVGSRQMMEDMVRAVEANHIKPVVDDRVFSLDQVREAYDYMWAQSHFGKLTIDLD